MLVTRPMYLCPQPITTITNFSLPVKERYLAFRSQYPRFEQRVPQYMIASYLGNTKEFLNKIRNQIIHGQ